MKTWKILALCSCLWLAECNSSSDGEPEQKRFGRLDYDIGQCELSPFDGERTIQKVGTGLTEPLNLFDKVFYLQDLESALNNSSYSIAERLFNSGLNVFRVKSLTNQELPCRYFDFLPEANAVSQESWDSIAKPGSQGSSLLGLFTTIYSKNNSSKKSRLKNPTIMVLDQTQKWTLLHEMSHYLFAKARTQKHNLQFNTELDEKLQSKLNTIEKLKSQINNGGNGQLALRLSHLYSEVFDLNLELDRRSALEEFSIEALLIDYANQGKINHIRKKFDSYQAFLYMKSNGDQVTFSYILFLDRLRDLRSVAETNNWQDAFDSFQSLIDRVQKLVDFIDKELEIVDSLETKQPGLSEISTRHEAFIHQHYDVDKFRRRHQILRNL